MAGHPEERCNCHRNEPVPRINLMMGLVPGQHASLIGFRIDCIKQTFQAGNDKREIYINNAISTFWWGASQWRWRFRKDQVQVRQNPSKYYYYENFHVNIFFCLYIKNKKHEHGIKFFKMCTNDGFVLYWKHPQSLWQTGAVVLHLMEPDLDKGYHFFTDNWYNSFPLTK